MSLGEAVKICFQKYFKLAGRARRSEFWYFYLFTLIISFVAGLIDAVFFDATDDDGPIGLVTSLAMLVPTITVTVRRLHDTDRPGYYIFLPVLTIALGMLFIYLGGGGQLINILGVIVMFSGVILQIVWLCQNSTPGPNRYGPNPIDHPNGEPISEVFE